MEQAQENTPSGSQVGSKLDDLVAKVKAVAQSSHGELFARIVDDFFEQITEEYFSPEDQAFIAEVPELPGCAAAGEVIAAYPDDQPFPSWPILGWMRCRPLHVLVAVEAEKQRCLV